MSVGQIFYLGRYDIGKTCFDVVKSNIQNKLMLEQEKASAALNVKQLKILLVLLKQKEYGVIPTKTKDLLERLLL